MSYLKDLPCAGCGTESTYYFPDKPTAHYCYCEFRYEIGEQIAQEIENCHEIKMAFANKNKCNTGECSHLEDAAIARGQDAKS